MQIIGIVTVVVLLIVAVFISGFRKGTSIEVKLADRYDDLIRFYANQESIRFDILKAVIRKESAFNHKALGDKGTAYGLMQIRKLALIDYNNAHGTNYALDPDLYDPEINIKVGSWYLGRFIRKYGTNIGVEMFNIGEQGYLNGKRNTKYLAGVIATAQEYA